MYHAPSCWVGHQLGKNELCIYRWVQVRLLAFGRRQHTAGGTLRNVYPMNVLIVTSHPMAKSLCSTFTEQIRSKLAEMGHDVVSENLYENEFNPVLSSVERKTYYEKKYDTSAVEQEIQRLVEAEALVLVFPTWWFGFPAILKGWFDRVWAPTVAYDHADDFGPIKPGLTQLKKAMVVTTLGAPWWVDFFILRRPLKRIIKHALLGACARKCKLTYISFYKCEKIDDDRMQSFLKKINAAVDQWLD